MNQMKTYFRNDGSNDRFTHSVLIKIFGGESYYQFLGKPIAVAILNIIFYILGNKYK